MKITENRKSPLTPLLQRGEGKTENHGAARPREKCGIFGIYGHPDAARLTYFGLYALQHRGQESAGIVASDGKFCREYKGMGLVP
ncbi:MAG TPA: hypothetical protein VGA79_05825, partial [Desulfobaccales bacterium]